MEGRAAVRRVALAVAAILTVLIALPAEAARKALVIGNGAYKSQPLANPVNDATDMAARLKALGFEVVLATDATRGQMAVAILDFQKRLSAGDEAVVFYAGHGVQVGGVNYLMPVDAEPGSEAEVEYAGIDLDKVLRGLNSTGTSANLLLLDACRNNPFEQKFRGGTRGLARVESASGTLISYAAAPGTAAADGRGRNSPYTRAVLAALEEPGLPVEDVLKRVHVAVRQATGDRQTTWQEGQIVGRLVLHPEKPKPVAPPASPAPPVPAFDNRLAEMKFWESADRDGSLAGYEAYLAQFPDGTFAALARARVARLRAPVATPAPAASSPDIEMRFWESADRGGSVAAYEAYLAQFPNGAFAPLARARVAELRATQTRPATTPVTAAPAPPVAPSPTAAAPSRPPATVPAAPVAAPTAPSTAFAPPAPVPATPLPAAVEAGSPARGDGVWEADSASGDLRLVVRRDAGKLSVALHFLRTRTSGRAIRDAGTSIDCDSTSLSADGKLDAWCSTGESRSRVTGQYPRFTLSGPIASNAGPFVVAGAPALALGAERASPAPVVPMTPTEARFAARMPANAEGVWEGTDENGAASLTIKRVGDRLTAVVVVASGRGGKYDDGVTECETADVPKDAVFETWCGSGGTWTFAQKLTGTHPVYRISAGNRHYPGGTFTLAYRPSPDEAAQIAAEKAAAGR